MKTIEQQQELMENAKITKKAFALINASVFGDSDKEDMEMVFNAIKRNSYDGAFRIYSSLDTIIRDEVIDLLLKIQK